jgi:hypothetical protein
LIARGRIIDFRQRHHPTIRLHILEVLRNRVSKQLVLLSAFERGAVMTKTVRSRFDHEVGGTVDGCTILERSIVIPPAPV